MLKLNKENKGLDFKLNILNEIEKLDSKVVKYGVKNRIDWIVSRVAILLYKNLEQHLYQYVESEIWEIKKELSGNGFFNLTDADVQKEVKERLNLGKTYVPFFKLKKSRELNQFNLEVSSFLPIYFRMSLNLKFQFCTKTSIIKLNN